MIKVKKYSILISIFLLLSYNNILSTEPSKNAPSAKEIVFGQTATLSGHLGLYGSMIKDAINACFQTINKTGGINGYTFRLESLDDQGNPEKSLLNIKTLKAKNIDMFIGCTGTRSILAALPQISKGEIAMFFPWAGHEKFRAKNLKYMINGLGYLKPQVQALVNNLVTKKQLYKISIFHADDDFSTEAMHELVSFLKQHNITPINIESYNRLTVDIVTAANKLINGDPKVVICLATSMPTVKLIDAFFERGAYETIFMGIDSTHLVNRILKNRGVNFSFSSSVPDPVASTIPIAKQYREDIALYNPIETPNILSFAYYLSTHIIVEAIKKIAPPITKEKIIAQIEQMQTKNIGGFTVSFDPEDRHIFGKEIEIIKG